MLRLIGDIGGTNARLAFARDGKYGELTTFLSEDFPSLEACIEAYLAGHHADGHPDEIAVAVAGPVGGPRVSLTNHPWSFDKAAMKARFKVQRLEVLNDFTANAVALPYLEAKDLEPVGGGTADPVGVKGVLGPGTGLGVSGLVRDGDGRWVPLVGEGGHVTMAPANDRESDVIEVLRRHYGHVSAERMVSGDGLVNIYESLCTLDGVNSSAYKPAQVADQALGEADVQCHEAVQIFCACLGTVAANLALTLGAVGGIYIAGGIVPRLGPRFAQSGFRKRFEDMGRFHTYLEPIPTLLIKHPNPALVGLASMP